MPEMCSSQTQKSSNKTSSIHVCMWNRAEVCTITSHSLLIPSWRASSGDCVTDGEDGGFEDRLGAGDLTDDITAEEADVPAPGLVNGTFWLTECTGCEESMPPENNSRKQEPFVCTCPDNYITQAITFDFTVTTKKQYSTSKRDAFKQVSMEKFMALKN